MYDTETLTLPVLRYVVAVADTGHFARAAAACGIAQPTLSAQIRNWEQRLGTTIFERARGGSRPTPVGERIIERAREALQALAAVEESARGRSDPLQGGLRLGAIPTIAPYLLPVLLPALESALPDLRLAINEDQTSVLLHDLQEHRIDCAVVARLESTAPFGSAGCYEEAFHLACPYGDPILARDHLDSRALLSAPLLLLREGHCFRDQVLDLCKVRPDHPRISCQASTLETLCQLVAVGYGRTLLPALALRGDEQRFAVRPLGMRAARRHVDLVWRPSDPRAADFRRLARCIHAAVQ